MNALNRLKIYFTMQDQRSTQYRAFVLPNLFYCGQVWYRCGARNTGKLEKVNERAPRFIYKNNSTSYFVKIDRLTQ